MQAATNWPEFGGAVSINPGLGYTNLPSANGAYPGTIFFSRHLIGTRVRIF